jgi:hypothetical protein
LSNFRYLAKSQLNACKQGVQDLLNEKFLKPVNDLTTYEMLNLTLAKIVSLISLLLILLHLLFPKITLDTPTIILLLVAGFPWLAKILKSIELPGGLKIEFLELEKVRHEADKAGLLATPRSIREEPAYLSIAQDDPNLALAGLRIEIEKRLKEVAKSRGLDADRQSIGYLLRRLPEGTLSQQEYSVLSDLIGLLNRAVHGADVDPSAAQWAMEVGPRLLAGLDERIHM